MKLGQVGVDSNIAQDHSSSLLEDISGNYGPIHMESQPKSKLGQVGVKFKWFELCAQNHSVGP